MRQSDWVVFAHRCMVSTSSHMFILSMMPLCHAWQTKIKIRFIPVLMKSFSSATVAISHVYPLFRKWSKVPYLVWDLLYQHLVIILDINYLLAFLYWLIGWETRSHVLRLWRFISILLNLWPTNWGIPLKLTDIEQVHDTIFIEPLSKSNSVFQILYLMSSIKFLWL